MAAVSWSNHGYEPQSKFSKHIRELAAGYFTLRFAGLFNLPIPLRFAFRNGVSPIMLELASHILDIAENSVRAGAKLIEIYIEEDTAKDSLSIEIIDDGQGMKQEEIKKVLDPFYTTKTVRRIGLGLPLLADASQRSGGSLQIDSVKGKGTTVKATFGLSHVDRQPMGNIVSTLIILIAGNSDVDFFYKYRHNDRQFKLDTREIRKEIMDVPINHPEILKYIRGVLEEGFSEIKPEF
jgi:anti-sigma regulatory factor (Ser/Thr protein kinase)